jgi:hypothetical protein
MLLAIYKNKEMPSIEIYNILKQGISGTGRSIKKHGKSLFPIAHWSYAP